MTQFLSIALLTFSSIASFGQGIQLTHSQAQAVLKDLADLDRLRVDSRADSATIAGLVVSIHLKDSALSDGLRIANDYHSLYSESDKRLTASKKEVKKQKFLKWLFLGGAAIVAVLSAR